MIEPPTESYDVCVVGGAGHVGIPLALTLADSGFKTVIFDINKPAMELMAAGGMPFLEEGGEQLLKKVLGTGRLGFSAEPKTLGQATYIVLTIGTPIDEFHNPNLSLLTRCLDGWMGHLRDDQTIVLRSTVAPGTTAILTAICVATRKRRCLPSVPSVSCRAKASKKSARFLN
jgi:UDP-N-acetyl-D-mannosaminuronic acid dehydrogenase